MVRVKERYLLVSIQYPEAPKPNATIPDLVVWNQPSDGTLSPDKLLRAIRAKAERFYGRHGRACLETMSVKYLSNATSTFILRIGRSHYRTLWAVLTLMDELPVRNSPRCIFNVVRVCGTMKKAENEAIHRARILVLAANDHSRALSQSEDTLGTIFGGGTMGHDTEMADVIADLSDDDDDNDLADDG